MAFCIPEQLPQGKNSEKQNAIAIKDFTMKFSHKFNLSQDRQDYEHAQKQLEDKDAPIFLSTYQIVDHSYIERRRLCNHTTMMHSQLKRR